MLTKLKILFLKWQIRLLLKQYHLAKNGTGRKKKGMIDINKIAEEMGHESPLDDQISNDYRTSHLGKFPGKNLGD